MNKTSKVIHELVLALALALTLSSHVSALRAVNSSKLAHRASGATGERRERIRKEERGSSKAREG